MKKEIPRDEMIPVILTYHGKILAACGDISDIFPPAGHFLWENFNSFEEKNYFRRRETCGIIPIISEGRELLLFFDTFSPDVSPNMQLFFDESISKYASDVNVSHILYDQLCKAGLSPAISEDIFLDKYIRVQTIASFFDIELSQNAIRQVDLYDLLKKSADIFSSHRNEQSTPEIYIMPQITETAETLSSPLSFCAAILLSLSIVTPSEPSNKNSRICVSKHDDLFEISVYTSSPPYGVSATYSSSRSELADIFLDRSNDVILLFKMAATARLSVTYGTEGDKFYLSVSFKARSVPASVKAPRLTESEEKILSVLADFLI